MRNAILFLIAILVLSACTQQPIIAPPTVVPPAPNPMFGQDLSGVVDAKDVEGGYLAKPKQPGQYPGIVMIHEWWGLNSNIKEMARILANEGYVVFAVDLYDGVVATNGSQAGALAGAVRANQTPAINKMKAAVKYLKTQQDITRIGSVGWCFGGGESLQLSLNDEVDATVIYYGQLSDNTTTLRRINGPVLGIFGQNDTAIPLASVDAFSSALDTINVTNEIYVYPGVGHAFANPSGDNFAPDETKDAWDKTLDFLTVNLKQAKTIQLYGVNFNFTDGNTTNPTIYVREGDVITVDLNSTGFHDFVIDELGARTEKARNATTSTTFVASKKGNFTYYCSVGMHRMMGMYGQFIVE